LLAGAAWVLDLSLFYALRFSTTVASPYVAEEWWNDAETSHFARAVRPKPAAGVGEEMNLRAADEVGSFVEASILLARPASPRPRLHRHHLRLCLESPTDLCARGVCHTRLSSGPGSVGKRGGYALDNIRMSNASKCLQYLPMKTHRASCYGRIL